MTQAGAAELATAAAQTPASATTLYTIATEPFFMNAGDSHNAGNLMPSTQVEVLKQQGDQVLVDVKGWQQDGVAEVFYAAQGKRILSVLLGDDAQKALKTLSTQTDPKPNWCGIRSPFRCGYRRNSSLMINRKSGAMPPI